MKTAHDVKLLNGSKQEVTYPGVETVTMPGVDGQDKVFTAGVPIDAMEIPLDFSGGDMPLEAPEGYVVRGATVKKPENAERVIAKGETLAGITGGYVTPGTTKKIEPDFSVGTETDFLPELTRTTELDDTYGYFIRIDGGTPLNIGDTYLVDWDGVAYTCVAQDAGTLMEGAVCIGNATAFGLSGNDEPFIAAYLQNGYSVVALTDTEPTDHTVRIYQVSEDQTVTAEGDERWSAVTVKKPEALVPENIAKGQYIAGVGPGAFDSGLAFPFMKFTMAMASCSTSATSPVSVSTSIPATAEIVDIFYGASGARYRYNDTTYLSSRCPSINPAPPSYITITESGGSKSVKCSLKVTYSGTGSYYNYVIQLFVLYTVPGLVVKKIENEYVMIADNDVKTLDRVYGRFTDVKVIDLSNSGMVQIPMHFIMGQVQYREVRLPKILESIGIYAFANCTGLELLDFSQCESVPTLGAYALNNTSAEMKIKVPQALYTEWASADGWSDYADRIIAV